MNKPLRILTVGHSYVVAMNRAVVRQVAADRRFDVTAVGPSFFQGDLRPINFEPEPDSSRLATSCLRSRWSGRIHLFWYNWNELKDIVRGGRFDIVHAWEEPYILSGFQIARAAEQSGARFCFRTDQNYQKRYPPPFCRFETDVRARAHGWIAGASLVWKTMLERGYPADRGRILPLAVDTTRFTPLSMQQKKAIRCELGFVDDAPLIGYLGRLTKAKGLEILTAALERLPVNIRWNALFVGGGDYEEMLRAWVRRRGWEGRVRILLARHDEVPRYLGAMDLIAVPSQTMPNWKEQFGRVLVEAFACHVPVIGSDSGEIPFVIGDAGLILPEKDIAAWTEAICKLLDSTALRTELKQRGIAVAQKYSVASISAQYREYYTWLRDQPGSRPC